VKTPKPKLVLASGSPRRRELLEQMGVPFTVVTSDVVELDAVSSPHLSPADLAIENARLKANAVARLPGGAGHWVLGADTVVALNHRVYGKPATNAEARKFLRKFRGRSHEVITGGVLLDPAGHETVFYDVSRVIFRDFSDTVVDRYLAQVHVLDKAGGYALQQHGDWLVERVEGSESNVIGFPVEVIERMLKSRGLL
jgi:septum formation protein